jgi:8-oxo-dGTP pyrophosphatase MutT (NUDIX family)
LDCIPDSSAHIVLLSVPLDYDFNSHYKLLLPNDTRPHGFITAANVSQLPWTSKFVVDHDLRTIQVLDSSDGKDPGGASIDAFQAVIDKAIDDNIFAQIHGRHSEMYKVIGANQFTYLERFTAPLFGIAGRGAHLTAYVHTSEGMKIWIARRSPHLFTYPNMLDTSVAGGVKADDTPFDCIVAEANEEASLPTAFVKGNAKAVGAVTYVAESKKSGCIQPTVLYVYDLELPDYMAPVPKDEEVFAFYLWSVEEVTEAMMRREFKPNCCLVMIDFFIRHGIISQENEADYLELTSRIHRQLPVPMAPERQ